MALLFETATQHGRLVETVTVKLVAGTDHVDVAPPDVTLANVPPFPLFLTPAVLCCTLLWGLAGGAGDGASRWRLCSH